MGQRYTSKGKLIDSNFQVEMTAPSTYRCMGCGREFSAHGGMRGPYSWAVDGNRWYALNRARAVRHADACKGDGKSAAA